MSLNLVRRRVLAIATIGVGSWIIAGELRDIINRYIENSFLLKIISAIVLIWIGIAIGE